MGVPTSASRTRCLHLTLGSVAEGFTPVSTNGQRAVHASHWTANMTSANGAVAMAVSGSHRFSCFGASSLSHSVPRYACFGGCHHAIFFCPNGLLH